MQSFNSIGAARDALLSLAYNPPTELAADIVEQLRLVASEISPVTVIVHGAELLFARRDELAEGQLELAAGLASFATENGWHGLAADERGVGLVRALRRDAGDETPNGKWPDAEQDPEALARFVKVDVPTEVTEALIDVAEAVEAKA